MTEVPRPSQLEIITVLDKEEGSIKAAECLSNSVDKDTLLLLSGGTSPDRLYEILAHQDDFQPGAVALVDERFGKPGHKDSNKYMIEQTGLFADFKRKQVPTATILISEEFKLEETSALYNVKVKKYIDELPKVVAIMGVGSDGHTAGILPNKERFSNPVFEKEFAGKLVGHFEDPYGEHKERVTLTPFGLAHVDTFIILAFGQGKKQVLTRLINGHESIEELPAMIFQQLAKEGKRAVLITDQPV